MITAYLLTGPDGAEPLGFLAALGMLRLLQRVGKCEALSWRHVRGVWRPVLHATAIDVAALRDDLANALASMPRPFAALGTSIKIPAQEFRKKAEDAQFGWRSDPETAAWMACLGSDLSLLPSGGNAGAVRPTPWDMTSGQQQFLGMVDEALSAMTNPEPYRGKSQQVCWDELLHGPWTGADPVHPMGWTPAAEAVYALRATNPSDDKQVSTGAAMAMAVAALPFFTVHVDVRARIEALALRRPSLGESAPRHPVFTWPLWREPIASDVIASLLALPRLSDHRIRSDLEARGICAVITSRRSPMGTKGYAVLRPASMVWENQG